MTEGEFPRLENYVTRDEFANLDRHTKEGFRNVHEALGELRRDIKSIGSPDLKLLLSTLSVFGFFVFSIGGAVSWGWIEKATTLERLVERHDHTLDERASWMGSAEGRVSRLESDMGAALLDLSNILRTRFSEDDHQEYARSTDQRFTRTDERVQRDLKSLQERIESELRTIKGDLASRAGHRWNRPNHEAEVKPYLDAHERKLTDHVERIAVLESKLAAVVAEQSKRTERVYASP